MNDPMQESKPSGNPKKVAVGIGMPASIYLQQYGDFLYQAFGVIAYQVGSSLTGPWRDVDVRVMLDKEVYAAMGFGDPKRPQLNARWCAYVVAFTAVGQKMTGLPIDFQIQELETANAESEGGRSALIMTQLQRSVKTHAVPQEGPVAGEVETPVCRHCDYPVVRFNNMSMSGGGVLWMHRTLTKGVYYYCSDDSGPHAEPLPPATGKIEQNE